MTWQDMVERMRTDSTLKTIVEKYAALNEDYRETLLTIDEAEREIRNCGEDECSSMALQIARKNQYAELSAMDVLLEVITEALGTDYPTAWVCLERYARKEVA